MSEQEINISIAEACGWTNVAHNTVFSGRKIGRGIFGNSPSGGEYRLTPNYCNDLNAMHEVEEAMSDDQYHTGYKQTLASLVGLAGSMRVTSAKACQRAEAFLRTIGKWEE